MKILIINPNSDTYTDNVMATKAKQLNLPGVEVDVVHCEDAPKLVGNWEEQCSSIQNMIDIVRSTQNIYDAYIDACHTDPNLDLLKEIAGKPVVGIAEASMKFAAASGNGYAVISPSPKSISRKIALARKYHVDDLLRVVKVSKGNSNEEILEAAKEAQKEFGVDAIALGCANYALADGYVEKALGIPVYDGVACALFIAAGLVSYKNCKKDY